jgi:hypothetical protein
MRFNNIHRDMTVVGKRFFFFSLVRFMSVECLCSLRVTEAETFQIKPERLGHYKVENVIRLCTYSQVVKTFKSCDCSVSCLMEFSFKNPGIGLV